MACYGSLAQWYDQFTGDVDYRKFADFYEVEFDRCGGQFHLLLDLCCGTGSLCSIMGKRGYEMIAVDASAEMLMQAQEKCFELSPPPLFLCQDAAELDLYGTVDAAFCSLDGINYIHPEDLPEVFARLKLFIRPGGLFIFDIRDPQWLESLNGDVFVDESDDALCLWRADFDREENAIVYGMDIFSRRGNLWSRDSEEHVEYAHSLEYLNSLLEDNGFEQISIRNDFPEGHSGRIMITAKRK